MSGLHHLDIDNHPSNGAFGIGEALYMGRNSLESDILRIRFLGIPEQGAKSRVETQIKLTLQLARACGNSMKAWPWTHVRLPERMMARKKHAARHMTRQRLAGQKQSCYVEEKNILRLEAALLCACDPYRVVLACRSCVYRERRRAYRDTLFRSTLGEDKDGGEEQFARDRQRVLLFTSPELVELQGGEVKLGVRMTCYCRHHGEKVGFIIHFQLRDSQGHLVAQGISPPILITDDHKRKRRALIAGQHLRRDITCLSNPMKPISAKELSSPLQSSKQAQMLPMLHERVDPTLADEANTTRLESAVSSDKRLGTTLPPTEPLSPSEYCPHSLNLLRSPASTLQIYPSPTDPLPTLPFFTPPPPLPSISRLVPSEGTVLGGTQITLLGSHFHPQLTPHFGETPALATLFWNETTIICLAPPAVVPGPVPVTFKDIPSLGARSEQNVYTYKDGAEERELMELALQVIGMKIGGKLESAHVVARRIMRRMHEVDWSCTHGSSESSTCVSGSNVDLRFLLYHLCLMSSELTATCGLRAGTLGRTTKRIEHPTASPTDTSCTLQPSNRTKCGKWVRACDWKGRKTECICYWISLVISRIVKRTKSEQAGQRAQGSLPSTSKITTTINPDGPTLAKLASRLASSCDILSARSLIRLLGSMASIGTCNIVKILIAPLLS
ncbi:uncharacterized protein VTP21DRAFT_3731 [Calcarisporiella thermophila]|uniref:uncharacterized protein n=1 Tax=Calcarisporiella thermophila TaxID=911321 RepID=UPI00374479A4